MTLTERLAGATAHLPAPVAVVDLDAFDANAADLRRRARDVPVRVASKSVRVRSLVGRALDAGFQGVMAFSLAEALWLVQEGVRDVLVGYPTVDRDALARLAADAGARREVTLMVDDVAQLALLDGALRSAGTADLPDVAVCLDVDASLRLEAGPLHVHLGTRRSPLRTPDRAAALARRVEAQPGARLRGLMFYEAQVAGLPDTNPAVRIVKRLSVAELDRRRAEVVEAVRAVVGHGVELVNSGGTGSLETSSAGPAVTEVTAGSGLFVPGLFDGYRSFDPRPAAFFGLDVARVPAPGWATAFGGGYVASGPAGRSRLPRVATPGWSLTGTEGAGEVMTPLRRRRGAPPLGVGDRVWLRHAKAGELMERFDVVHLVRGDEIVESVPTYRGEGRTFG
ncbi:alanine racemase [Krasilnikoviella flava]|uniref:D-serine deaminase, pyridoxal phosphate-dependent n=1 Tax=Krasilnikoviella flava TaxID=526729 RepID=A0A1T5IJI2_9MICO|nr:alanine racemase [Krasilnikoviella flava]SKC39307.1 D-serine deaminase, pyridoxal phosphate-dependent [Krasilnikoviella flava]